MTTDPPFSRANATGLDPLLGHPFPVLDDGFVRVVDYMGDDAAILQAARVSYQTGTRKLRDDRALIRYLLRKRHTTPFEMCELKLHVRVPMDVWRQWIRHRTASVNEYSTRYSIAIDATAKTQADAWRKQSQTNKQGSGGFLPTDIGEQLTAEESNLHRMTSEVYKSRLDAGVAREQARKDLPLSTYTEAYWKIDLHNLLHFLRLRMDPHAQYEIRQYANVIGNQVVSNWCPLAWEAYRDYQSDSVTLFSHEIEVLRILGEDADSANELILSKAVEYGLLTRRNDSDISLTREGAEFSSKLELLGDDARWAKITSAKN